jgi:tape measure domain-containing protein
MASVRDLVTKFLFETDDKGLKEYDNKVKKSIDKTKSGFDSLKKSIGNVGAILGTELAIGSALNFITSLTKEIRNAKSLGTKIGQVLTPDMDKDTVMKQLFDLAQSSGGVYTEVAANFRDVAIAAREASVNQNVALEATTNITKALEVGRASGEDAAQTWASLNGAFRLGQVNAKQLNQILFNTPKVVETLAQGLGKSVSQLQQMAKDGKLTTKEMFKGFSAVNKLLNQEFIDKPASLGDAMNYVWNEMVRVGLQVWKLTSGMSKLADKIISVTKAVVDWGSEFIAIMGGAENALSLVEYAIYAAFGYQAISLLYKFGAAALFASLKFVAIGAAIALVAIALQDLVYWFQGKKSLIGKKFGSFDEVKENLLKGLDNITKPFTDFKDKIVAGDWSGAFGGLLSGMSNIHLNLLALGVAILAVETGFKAWNLISWAWTIGRLIVVTATTWLVQIAAVAVKAAYLLWNGITFVAGLIKSLFTVIARTTAVETAAVSAKLALESMNSIKFGGLISAIWAIGIPLAAIGVALGFLWLEKKKLEADVAKATDAIKNKVAETGKAPVAVATIAKETGMSQIDAGRSAELSGYYKGSAFEEGYQEAKRWIANKLGIGDYASTVPVVPEEQRQDMKEAWRAPASADDKNKPIGTPAEPVTVKPHSPIGTQPSAAIPSTNMSVTPEDTTKRMEMEPWMVEMLNSERYKNAPLSGAPTVAPGAIAQTPTVSNEQTNNVPITNNVNVTVPAEFGQLEAKMTELVNNATNRMAEDTARQLTRSMPRMETAVTGESKTMRE